MTTDELLSYADGFEACLFIDVSAMRTKKGELKKRWFDEFYRYDELEFENFARQNNLEMPTTGAAVEAGVRLLTPCGRTFCMLFFTKQPHLWLSDAQAVASFKCITSACINGRNLSLSSGKSVALDACEIEGYNLIPSINK